MKRVRKENDPQKRDDASSITLPQDLIIEILLKLPAKSLPKLILVSKLWSFIIRSKYFSDLYLNHRSLTRPCILFTFHRDNIRFFHSSSEAAPSSCAATSSIPLSPDRRPFPLSYNVSPPVRGLICCQDLQTVVVSNPSTGQFLVLPKLKTRRRRISRFFGYDPIKDEYKVLCMTVLNLRGYKPRPVVSEEHQVFTLGAARDQKKEATWRMIECKLPHCPATEGLCMTNGVIYYGAWTNSDIHRHGSLVVAFDVRLEEFSFVKLPDRVYIDGDRSKLVNYQRKVALVNTLDEGFDIWVLEDVDKQEWSKIFVVVPRFENVYGVYICRGAISSGEIIFKEYSTCPTFTIISYDRKEDITRRIEIEGICDRLYDVTVFLDHVECPIFL